MRVTVDGTDVGAVDDHWSVVFMRWSAPPPALRKYHKAADAGNAGAMTNIGFMYDNGHGVKEDYTEAMRWYRKAADRGDDDAKATLESLKGK